MKFAKHRPFSIKEYLLVVFGLSWPFQIAYGILGEWSRPLLLVSMVMAGAGAYICGRYIFKDGFSDAGWRLGKPVYYFVAFGLALLLWAFPVLVEQVGRPTTQIARPFIFETFLIFTFNFMVTLIPAFGEELAWRGYMLPRLLKQYTVRRAVLFHAFITWVWHLPVLFIWGYQMPGEPFVNIPVVLLVSLVPAVLHGVIFAYFWMRSQSMAVVTAYHSAFDEVRDTLERSFGFGPLAQNWQMGVIILIGAFLLSGRRRWQRNTN